MGGWGRRPVHVPVPLKRAATRQQLQSRGTSTTQRDRVRGSRTSAQPVGSKGVAQHAEDLLRQRAQFWTLRHVDAATYQILGNLKIVTTGVLLWACLRRPLSLLQALALLLLMVGATISQARCAWAFPGVVRGSYIQTQEAQRYTVIVCQHNRCLYWLCSLGYMGARAFSWFCDGQVEWKQSVLPVLASLRVQECAFD